MATSPLNFQYSDTWPASKLGPQGPDQKARNAQKYLQVLAQQRLLWEPMIDNLILYCNHGRRTIQDKDLWPGQPTGAEVFSDEAILAKGKLVDGLCGYTCSRNQPWFALTLPGKINFPRSSNLRAWSGKRLDSYPQVQQWLQDAAEEMYAAFNSSNFYDVNTEFVGDGAVTGTGYILGEEDLKSNRIVFTVPHFRECFIGEDCFGKVDTHYRVYKLTLRQFVQQFGIKAMERADDHFRQDYENNMYQEREVLHAVYPREDYDPRRIDNKGKRWESVWVYRKGGKILESAGQSGGGEQGIFLLSEGGYDSWPMISWRWRKNSDEIYGRGPAHDAWISIAKDNQMGRTNLVTAQKSAEPPLYAPADMKGKIQRGPNAITFDESIRGDIRLRMPQPIYTGVQNLPFNVEFQDRVKKTINDYFYTDVFMLLSSLMQEHGSGRPVTAQISELQTEKAAMLGERVGNLQSEAFNPIIARVFDIESRAGRIPDPPEILFHAEHRGVLVEYLGLLAQAQTRLTKVRAIQSGVALAQQVTAFDPLAMHRLDSDQVMEEAWLAVGAPVSCLRSREEMEQIRAEANKQMQQERQLDAAVKIGKAASLAGKSAEPDSPLRTLMGGGKEPGENR